MLRSMPPPQWLSVATERYSFGGQTSSREARTLEAIRDARQGSTQIRDIVTCDNVRVGPVTSVFRCLFCFSVNPAGQSMLLASLSQIGSTTHLASSVLPNLLLAMIVHAVSGSAHLDWRFSLHTMFARCPAACCFAARFGVARVTSNFCVKRVPVLSNLVVILPA